MTCTLPDSRLTGCRPSDATNLVVSQTAIAYNLPMNMDLAAKWVIYAPSADMPAAAVLSSYISLLTNGAREPRVLDANAPAESDPVIVLNNFNRNNSDGGFYWRLGRERVEIFGNSRRGLWNGIFDFLDALGVKWPEPGKEELPASGASIPLARANANYSTDLAHNRKRFFLKAGTDAKEREALVAWAARNKYDALVFPVSEKKIWTQAKGRYGIGKYAMLLEACLDVSSLLPRRLFLFNRELFRMEEGQRRSDIHFCPTNPKTSTRIGREAARLFANTGGMAEPKIFHLLPEKENSWCSCPACRAFSRREQYLIAVNTAADALAGLFPGALLSYQESKAESEEPSGKITPRKNTFTCSGEPSLTAG